MADPISLDGTWDFLHTGSGARNLVEIRKIQVPGPWQAQFADLRRKSGIGIYRRHFNIPAQWKKGHVRLHFGAVFHNCRVWLNEEIVGTNEGGFLPFSFDVTNKIKEGQNEIKVRVESPIDDPGQHPDAPLGEMPFGKQSWYGPLSGIWQSVFLECRDPHRIDGLQVRALFDEQRVDVRLGLATAASGELEIEFDVVDSAGDRVASGTVPVLGDGTHIDASLAVPGRLAWSPEDPQLYTLRASVRRLGEEVDVVIRRFGFRTFQARDGAFWLNGRPIHVRAALDQDYYPDTICTPPSMELIEEQLHKAKELGLNCIRLHIKVADPRYLDAADRIGILIWAELPNGGVSTERSRRRKEALLKGMVDRDAHHPSIVIWTIINENWGVDLVHDETHRAWLKRTFDWLKAYDPMRLVVDNSPLHPSFHVKSDIADYHFYAAIPDSRHAWDAFVGDLAARGSFLFGPSDECESSGQEPLLCSEFGNWGLPDLRLIANPDGSEPWYFETGHDWGGGVMYPHGIEHRFHDWHLDRVFDTLDALVTATQWHQFAALKYEIERMRLRPELAGYVITELTDVHWEANGLLDMRRNAKPFHNAFRFINADTVVIPQIERWAYWTGELLRIEISIVHSGKAPLSSLRLEVTAGGSTSATSVTFPELQPGQRRSVPVDLELPHFETAQALQVGCVLFSNDVEAARNWVDIAVIPSAPARVRPVIWVEDNAVAGHLAAMGYVLTGSPADAELLVARSDPSALAPLVRSGKRILVLCEEPMSLYPFFPHWQNVKVEAREGTPWQGDWASAFSWLHRGRVFSRIPGGPLLDLAFDRVIPRHVISGCNQHDFHGRVHAGIFVGWLHKSAALVVERTYGRGHLVATTFQLLRDPPAHDPMSSKLLDCLIELASASADRYAEPERGPNAKDPFGGSIFASETMVPFEN